MIMNCQMRIFKWIQNHPFSFGISSFYFPSSVASYYFFTINHNSIIGKILELFIGTNFNVVALTSLFIILFSGIEASVGRLKYSLWMIWNFVFLFFGRLFVEKLFFNSQSLTIQPTGPNCCIFCPFLTFIFVHRPYMYFKIKKFRFTDTLLYSIAIVQFILFFDIINLISDFFICSLSNVFSHVLIYLLANVCRRPSIDQT